MPHAVMFETTPSVSACSDALGELLTLSARLRPELGFKNALTNSELKDQLDSYFGSGKDASGQLGALNFVAIDAAFKRVLYAILSQHSIQEPDFSAVWHLLDIANMLSYREQCEPSMTMGLAEELFESQTTEGCRTVFEYLELRQDIMFKKSWKDKQQITLRVCNELLRRFSRADNSIFCGRIFIYLFQVFPLGDRSSVNLRGTYHTENKTTWEQIVDTKEVGEAMEVDEVKLSNGDDNTTTQITITSADQVPGNASTPTTEVLDLDSLYPIFWSLQDYFSNPKLLFEATNLTLFKAGLEAVLAKFHQIRKSHEPRQASISDPSVQPKLNSKRKWSQDDGDSSEGLLTFNPKYLTSRDLFSLEISSVTFRRHVLVQALILLEFLLFQTASGREKQNTPVFDPSNPNKSLRPNASAVYAFELVPDEASWAADKKSEIASYLAHGPEGKSYYQMVETVLSRDKNWVIWKAHNCLEFVLPSLEPGKFVEAQKSAIKATTAPKLKASPMGAFDISFLHDPDGQKVLKKLRNPTRSEFPPPLSNLEEKLNDVEFDLDTVIKQTEGADEGEADADEDGPIHKKNRLVDLRDSLRWRALRVGIRRGRLKWFDRIDGDNGRLDAVFRNPVVEEKEEVKAESDLKDGDEADEQQTEEKPTTNGDTEMKDGDGDVVEVKAEVDAEGKDQGNDTLQQGDASTMAESENAKGEPIPVFEFGDDS